MIRKGGERMPSSTTESKQICVGLHKRELPYFRLLFFAPVLIRLSLISDLRSLQEVIFGFSEFDLNRLCNQPELPRSLIFHWIAC